MPLEAHGLPLEPWRPTRCASHIFPTLLARVIGARTFLSAFVRWSTPKPTGGQECPMSLGLAPTKYARPGHVVVPEGHSIIAQRSNVGNQRPWSDKSRRDG